MYLIQHNQIVHSTTVNKAETAVIDVGYAGAT